MPRSLLSLDCETLRVIVGFDFEAGGRRALRHALTVAQRHAACEIHVLYACSSSDPAQAEWLGLPGQLWARVCEQVEEMPAGDRARVVTHVRRGPAGRCLARLAAQLQADFILLGAPPKGALGGESVPSANGEADVWVVNVEDAQWAADSRPRQAFAAATEGDETGPRLACQSEPSASASGFGHNA